MHRRLIAALGSVLVLLFALIGSRGDRPVQRPAKAKLPKALGAIHPRLSPDGSTLALSYQGEIWTGPRARRTMTLLTPSQGFASEPARSADGKRVSVLRG